MTDKGKDLKARADNALTALHKALGEGKSERLQAFIASAAQFHNYSLRNVCLIHAQCEKASRVAGFNAWKKLGRHVCKGQKGIRILAPCTYKRENEAGETETGVYGFRCVSVFDVSQTDGEPLPDFEKAQGNPGEWRDAIEAAIRARGITLEYEAMSPGCHGYSQGGHIAINDDLDPATTFSVLAHEFAHELLHDKADRVNTTKTTRETEAESVAAAVCGAIGFEGIESHVDYLLLYDGERKVFEASLDRIRGAVRIILDGMNEQREGVSHATTK